LAWNNESNLGTSMAEYLVAAVAGLGVGVIAVLALQDTQWPQFATMAFPLAAAASATTIQNLMTRFSHP
jgi:Tfp pilus assembly protein PilV